MQAKILSYSAALKANLRLVVYDIDTENNTSKFYQQKRSFMAIFENDT